MTNVIIHHCKPLSAFCQHRTFVTQLATAAAYMLMPSESASSIHKLDDSVEIEGSHELTLFDHQQWQRGEYIQWDTSSCRNSCFQRQDFLLPKLSVQQSIWSAVESHEIQCSPIFPHTLIKERLTRLESLCTIYWDKELFGILQAVLVCLRNCPELLWIALWGHC